MHVYRLAPLVLLMLIAGCGAPTQPLELPVQSDLSTPLNDRFESISEDPYCLNVEENSDALSAFLEDQFGDSSANIETVIDGSLAENSQRKVVSVCRYGEEPYVLEYQGGGEEFEGYRVYTAGGNEPFEIGTFLSPLGRVVQLSTQLFADEDLLGMSSRSGDASMTSWYYYTIGADANSVVQVEWCDRYFGGGYSPYGDEPTLDCEYRYDSAAQ